MRFWKIFAIAALAVCAYAADIAGKWNATMQGPDGEMKIVFNFKMDGDKLTGTATGPMGDSPMSDIKLDGDNISFTVNAGDLKIVHKGTVNGNEMKLKVDIGDQTVDMTATRAGS
ncbi:MAG: hypothetical protein WA324_03195 [Bryobacteraceae bacterium]